MKQRKGLDFIVVVTTCAIHIVVGFSLRGIGRIYGEVYRIIDSGTELPSLTSLVVEYTSSSAPILAGLALAIASGISLGILVSSERMRPLFPFAVVVSLVIAIIHLANCWLGLNMGLISVVNQSQQ